jgi:hypothetical protein
MAREISHTTEIDAPTEAVWNILTDTAAYPDWNPFVRQLEGELREGARLDVRISLQEERTMRFTPTVLAVRPARELRWRGRFVVRGLFDGEHSFELEELAAGRTRFTQRERFSGPLVRPFGRMLDETEIGFAQMNEALKARAEAG